MAKKIAKTNKIKISYTISNTGEDIIEIRKKRKYYWVVINKRARNLGSGILLTSESYESKRACSNSARAYNRRNPNHDFVDTTK